MANRTITIVDNASSKKVVLNGDFTTFGEVLDAARAQGINTTGVDFMEGLTKTIFNRADALLPNDVDYKGTTTNNLVFAVTASNKRVKSGVDRNELKIIIQSNNLGEAIKEMFGKNWTICTNAELEQAVNSLYDACPAEEDVDCEEACGFADEYEVFVQGIAHLLAALKEETLEDILACVHAFETNTQAPVAKKPEVKSPYSDEELEDILAELD